MRGAAAKEGGTWIPFAMHGCQSPTFSKQYYRFSALLVRYLGTVPQYSTSVGFMAASFAELTELVAISISPIGTGNGR